MHPCTTPRCGIALIGVQANNLIFFPVRTRPPAFDFNVREQQRLAVIVDLTLSYPHDTADGVVMVIVVARLLDRELGNVFSAMWLAPITVFLGAD